MSAPSKLEFDELCESMQIFLHFPDVEKDILEKVEEFVEKILLSPAQNGTRNSAQVMSDYLNGQQNTLERIKVIAGFSHGSREKLKQIFKAIYPDDTRSYSKAIEKDDQVRKKIAEFLVNPDSEKNTVPAFVRKSFALPENWTELLQDRKYLERIAYGNMQSLYSVSIGNALEKKINSIVTKLGYEHQKGSVKIVGGKEVDIAIPNTDAPKIIIMSSYMITTSSAQSSRANEQAAMQDSIRAHNRLPEQLDVSNVIFVNVIDGGGWLDRRKDLKRIWQSSDYCLSYSRLSDLESIIKSAMP